MWWWCLIHARVERDAGCAHQVRLGPFDSEAAAADALDAAQRRNRDWDQDQDDD
ncbi:MAG: hypothetical protein KGP01_00145 [Actinomycetales bacterium]|nr:hypothetical protein [Actinomycetales bacterium]